MPSDKDVLAIKADLLYSTLKAAPQSDETDRDFSSITEALNGSSSS